MVLEEVAKFCETLLDFKVLILSPTSHASQLMRHNFENLYADLNANAITFSPNFNNLDYNFIFIDDADCIKEELLKKVVASNIPHYITGTPNGSNLEFYKLLKNNPHQHIIFNQHQDKASQKVCQDIKKLLSPEVYENDIMAQYTSAQIENFERRLHELERC